MLMRQMGHQRTFALQQTMSALPLKADIDCVEGSRLPSPNFCRN
jgi:hypothetical protein